MKFQNLLFELDKKTGNELYGEACIYFANKMPMFGIMNKIRGVNDAYAAYVLQIFDLYNRKDDERAQAMIDYVEKMIKHET